MAYGQPPNKEHAFQAFSRDMKNRDFPPLVFAYGQETYLIDWACKSIIDLFVNREAEQFDLLRFAGDTCTADELIAACETMPIFSERRVVTVSDFTPLVKKTGHGMTESEEKRLSAYIADPNPAVILVFTCEQPLAGSGLVKLLKKECRCYDFSALDERQFTAFAAKRFREAGVSVDAGLLRYLTAETGYFNRESEYRLYNLENDIKKIIAHCGDSAVTREDIDSTLRGDEDSFVFDFMDALTSGKKGQALRLMHNVLGAGEDIFPLLGLLVNQFELLLEVKELRAAGMSAEKMAARLKMNAYRVKKAAAAAERMSAEKIRKTLSGLYETDRSVKTGVMEPLLSLELMIGRL